MTYRICCLFCSAIGGEITSDGDFLIFEGNRYSRKGFLYKNFLMSAILSEGVKPTLAELERFEEQPEGTHTVRISTAIQNVPDTNAFLFLII